MKAALDALPSADFIRMSADERALGWVSGTAVSDRPPRPLTGFTAREQLRAHFGELVRAGRQVWIAFSGGVDSSLLLAIAAEAARLEGTAPPVPVTIEYADDSLAAETEWQNAVISHLGLREVWQRIVLPPAEDLVGPKAFDILDHTGVCWPAAYLVNFRAVCETAPEHAVIVTGDGGDEALGIRRITALAAALRGRRPTTATAKATIKAVAPRPARAAAFRRTWRPYFRSLEWLRPALRERGAIANSRDKAAEPLDFTRSSYYWARRRAADVGRHNMKLLAHVHGVDVDFPLWSDGFSGALSSDAGRLGWLSRRDCVGHIAGDLLPRAVIERRSKAVFNTVLFGPSARMIAQDWDGTGLDPDLVDADRLRAEWRRDVPHGATFFLLQEVALLMRASG